MRPSRFPREESYGLTSQLRRSAVSVASNVAEGQGRISKPEFRQFLGMARGSLIEMETQIVIASNLGYISRETFNRLGARSGEVSRLLHGLMQSLQPQQAPRRGRLATEEFLVSGFQFPVGEFLSPFDQKSPATVGAKKLETRNWKPGLWPGAKLSLWLNNVPAPCFGF